MNPPTIRPLTADETRALTAARLVALEHVPYFAAALFAVRPVAAEGLGTFAVDGQWRLYIDPQTLREWGPQLSGGVLAHEVSHLLRDHAGRAQALGAQRDHVRWNYATDAAINDDLVAARIPLPEGAVTPEALGLSPNGIEEAYYAAISPQDPEDEGGCGSGAGDPSPSWELDGAAPAAPGLSPARAAITRKRVAQQVLDASSKGRGTVPAGLRRWADDALAPRPLPWKQVLSGIVRRAAALTSGRVTYTYSRPGRRHLPGIVTPALRAPRVQVGVVVDTSGSMRPDDLGAALNEVSGIVKAVGGGVQAITCDAEAGAAQLVRSPRDLDLTGGGGTDMRVGIAAAEALRERPDVIVVLTDGMTPWPDRPTRARLIVVVIGGYSTANVPAWATPLAVPTLTAA